MVNKTRPMRGLFLKGIAIAMALGSGPAIAQLVSESDAPIDITSDSAEFQDELAIWIGNVRVIQEDAVLTSNRMEATISSEGNFESITAIGDVRYSNGKEAITGNRAVYDEGERTITMFENVIVTQGRQVMAAGQVTYWIDTGRVQFAPSEGQRIRGIFYTSSDEDSS